MAARSRRRRLDPDTRYRVMQIEAWRHIGKKHAYLIAFGPFIARAVLVLLAVAGLMVLWLTVNHTTLGVAALILAGLLGVGWLAYTQSNAAIQHRQALRARGKATRPGLGLGWAVSTAVVLLGATGWLALGSPWA